MTGRPGVRCLTFLALCAALAAAVVMASGCGSPAAEQESEKAVVETTEAPEEGAAEEGEAAEPAPAEGAPAEAAAEQATSAPAQPAPPAGQGTSSAGGAAAAAAGAAAVAASQALPSAEEEAPPAEAAPEPARAEQAAAAPPATDWTGTAQRWVPIFSLEREGARVGAAQVAGPTAQVAKVKGVAELRLRFKDIGRIYAYIPVSEISLTRQKRVQGVSVWAIGDIELVDF